MKIIDDALIAEWLANKGAVSLYKEARQGFGSKGLSDSYLTKLIGWSQSFTFALESLVSENPEADSDAMDSISLFSLFKGLFLPLSGINPVKVGQLFGFTWKEPDISRHEIIRKFFNKKCGLSLTEKVACIMGDPFLGKPSYIGHDTLTQVLASIRLDSVQKIREELPKTGDIGAFFNQGVSLLRSDPPILAKEAFLIIRNLPGERFNKKKKILRDIFQRSGLLERYFMVRLLLRRLNFGYQYQSDLIISILSEVSGIPEEDLENGLALTDIFTLTKIIENEGQDGLKRLVLTPLHPVNPALAGTLSIKGKQRFPIWFERKYDGIRLMLHKVVGKRGEVLTAAFTRRKNDWLSLVPGLEAAIHNIPAYSLIIDGELYADILRDEAGLKPATVYEVHKYLQGERQEAVMLKYIAFDILYMNGSDLTNLPFIKRRDILEKLIAPLSSFSLPFPILISDGKSADSTEEINKLFVYFRNQGYEGGIAKTLDAPYPLGKRTDFWMKKKPEITLDLVLGGAIWSTGDSGPVTFSSYLLFCQNQGSLIEVGQVQGLSKENNIDIINRIITECLLTGRTLERRTAHGVSAGIEIVPSIIVTVRFEGVIKDSKNVYSLRDPKAVCIRPRGEKPVNEIDSLETLQRLYLKERL